MASPADYSSLGRVRDISDGSVLILWDEASNSERHITVSDFKLSLAEWTSAEAYEPLTLTRDSDGVITTATVKWPDGSTGTFTRTTKNNTFLSIDAYTITHTDSGKTVTQSLMTRDTDGNVTVKPALTIA